MRLRMTPIVAGLVCAGLAGAAFAADHRLAFSQANQLEVFITHTDGQPWCAEALTMEFRDAGAANIEVLEKMMPQLGALLGRECPTAATVSWRSLGESNQVLASGSSSAGADWALQRTVAEQPVVAETTAAPAPVATAETPVEQPAVEAEAVADAEVPAALAEATQATEEAMEASAVAEPTEAAAVASVTPEAEPADPEPVIAEKPAEPAAAITATDFAVGSWTPRSAAQTLQASTFVTTLEDQQGCRFYLNFNYDVLPEYLRVQSKDVGCDAQGHASGEGTLTVQRSDGQGLSNTKAQWYMGLPFVNGKPLFTLQHVQATEYLYGLLGTDAERRIHYLIEARGQRNGTWELGSPRVLVVTENVDLFRDAEQISAINNRVLELLNPLSVQGSTINILAVADPSDRFAGKHRENTHWLYQTALNKPWRGSWQVARHGTTNHLFEKEARLAREQAVAEERARQQREMEMRRAAAEQERYLELYERLSMQPTEQRVGDWIREPGATRYGHMLRGAAYEYRQIIQLTGKQDEQGAIVQTPYPARLQTAASLEKGWYAITGQAQLDSEKQDSQGLPLTVITVSQAVPCDDAQCASAFTPDVMVAQAAGMETWSVQQARELMEKVANGQFE